MVNLSMFAGAGWQFFNDNGVPLAGGLVYTYTAGTSTPQTTYTSSAGNVANSNPIVLDAAGRVPNEIWLTQGVSYKFILKDSLGVQIGSWDNIQGANDGSGYVSAADLANTSNVALGDALVGFKQSNSSGAYTGAIGRTVHQKFQEFVSVKDFGAVGDGVTDDSGAFIAAVTASLVVVVPPGNYLIEAQVNIPSANQEIIGTGGTIIRGTALAGASCFYANAKNYLTFQNLNFQVQSTQPHDQSGQFIVMETCHDSRVIDCVFDAERKTVLTNKESLFSAVNTPSCNRLLIQGNIFRYLYGNCCGANDGVGSGVNGQNVTIVGNIFYNHVDTGVGCWTNAGKVTIAGNVFQRDDYSTSYNGVHIDIAGASYVAVTGNVFTGNTIGVRMLSNLGYSNNGNLIEGNTFLNQVDGVTEPATCIKISHYTNGSTSNNEDVIIRGNTMNVTKWGVNVVSTVTNLSKVLTIQIDGNRFDISAANCTGVVLQHLNPYGSVKHIPGSNTFIGAGAGSSAVAGNGSGTEMHLTSQQNSTSRRTNFQFTGTSAQNLSSFYAERGCYCLAASVGTCVDNGGVGGILTFNTLNGAALTCMNTGGSDKVINAAVSNTKWDNFFYVVPTDDDYEARFSPHISGNTDDYYYLSVIRIV